MFDDAMSGDVEREPFAYDLELCISNLAEFLRDPTVGATISSGSVQWAGRSAQLEPGGRALLFAPCDAGCLDSRVALRFAFEDARQGRVEVQIEKRVLSASPCDPAMDLSNATVRLILESQEAYLGELRCSCADVLHHLNDIRVVPRDAPGADEALAAFSKYVNGECVRVASDRVPLLARLPNLKPEETRALLLALDVLLPNPRPPEGPTPPEFIETLTRFVGNADPGALNELRRSIALIGALEPVLRGHKQYLSEVAEKALASDEFSEVKAAFESLHIVAALGYYSHAKSYKLLRHHPRKVEPRHKTLLPVRSRPSERVFDVAIVGSGVAGSLLAERLSEAGKSVVILESGPYYPEKNLYPDEVTWLARLQRRSVLQRANCNLPFSASARGFPVLQGHCVGGGAVINNAVCFQMPEQRLEAWRGVGFPIEPALLRAAYGKVACELGICPASVATPLLNPAGKILEAKFQVAKLPRVDAPPEPGYFECLVNLQKNECLGCGLCNTGCPGERKNNALQVHLPRALGAGRDCELVERARVEELVLARTVAGTPLRIEGLRVKYCEGSGFVRASEYVLSAGAIHSSALLMKSKELFTKLRNRNAVGRRFCANIASPVFGFFGRDIHCAPSLQLTHYYWPEDPHAGFVIENLYNPPGQSAAIMPGFGAVHTERMRKYRRTALLGAVVPTLPNGRIDLDRNGDPVISLPLSEYELDRTRRGLVLAAQALFAAHPDFPLESVVAGVSNGGFEMFEPADVERFGRWLQSFQQVELSTGHPQGGSAMSDDPRISVVDREFRLQNVQNLRICDGSLFPLPAGVNPQWTIMALAHLCANVVLGRGGV